MERSISPEERIDQLEKLLARWIEMERSIHPEDELGYPLFAESVAALPAP
jgi:hypothetical protein